MLQMWFGVFESVCRIEQARATALTAHMLTRAQVALFLLDGRYVFGTDSDSCYKVASIYF